MDTLLVALEAAVPLHILDQRTWTAAARQAAASEAATIVGSHGDALQYGGKHCAEAFNALARGIALLARQAGGVTFHGVHWEVP